MRRLATATYRGCCDTRYSWVIEGRSTQSLDDLLAEGKAVPMIVVVPEAHALPPEPTQDTSRDAGLYYMSRNQRAVDEELFHDIIPFIQTHYKISNNAQERAIAGLSMGGLQAIETGIGASGLLLLDWCLQPGRSAEGVLQRV
jgi:enterochelin esterase-like enzyme